MNFDTIHFNLSEEAFLLKSLNEVTKVWARASGKASFNLSVNDGQAQLQLGFQLGLPNDYHLPPPRPATPRYKGSVRKERDRLPAAEHQARLSAASSLNSKLAAPATVESPSTASVVPPPCPTPSSTAVPASPMATSSSKPKVPEPTIAVPASQPTSIAAASVATLLTTSTATKTSSKPAVSASLPTLAS